MLIASFGQTSTAPAAAAAAASSVTAPAAPVMPSQATRDPFQRPANARPGFIPQSLQTEFVPEFEAFPTVMHWRGGRGLPRGVRNPPRSEPGAETPRADPSGQSSLPVSVPSPVKMRAGRMMPPGLVMALGIMPPVRGVRADRVNPLALVAAGRNPTGVG
jgi:hypothetical protein